MPLAPGTRLGPYTIAAPLGAGGMGEVYKATDTNLGRQVAIKVLPEAFAQDTDRLSRFEREARTLAALNHTNIAQIYGLERSDGVLALVMELVEGPTLAARIVQGAIPVDEALPIAKQIAEALEAAHQQGIIHRDLKPANIKVRPDGTVKVLDFGLAKALEVPSAISPSTSQSPTITTPAMTQMGMILGTAAYMSPEQARGKPVDRRADIWAFGCVLFEMLSGHRAFDAEDVTVTLARVVEREPDLGALPSSVPSAVRHAIRLCLRKDPRVRIRDISDVRLALEGAFDAPAEHLTQSAVHRPSWQRALPVVTAVAAAVLTGLAVWSLRPPVPVEPATRFEYVLPEGQQLRNTQRPIVALARDGRAFVYQTNEGMYIRSLGHLQARLIPGTAEAATTPLVSPDGQWVAFFAGQLKKVASSGEGPAVVLATAPVSFGGSWSPDNTILFGHPSGVIRVSADGGTPELIIKAADGEQIQGPQMLPGGDVVLLSVTKDMGPARWDRARVVAHSLSTGKRTPLIEGGSNVRYLPAGYLMYAVGDTLFAVAFDAARLAVTSAAVPIVQGLARPVGVNAVGANYDVADDGTLMYVAASPSLRLPFWMNRDGSAMTTIASIPQGSHEDPRLSPDGSRALVTRDGDIWIYELDSGRSSRVTRDGSSLMGVWSPTGSQVAYSSARGGNLEAWVGPSDGSGQPRQLTKLGGQVHVDSWSPDGRILSVHHHPVAGPTKIYMLALDQADPKPEAFLDGAFGAESATFSRDGRYVAFLSTENGQREIYIRPYPGPGGQVTVSVGGGQEPIWARNGDLFYRSLDATRTFGVAVTTTPALKVGAPLELFQRPYYFSPTGSPRAQYDVTPDGKRFLVLGPSGDASTSRPRIVVVQDWMDELKRLVPAN